MLLVKTISLISSLPFLFCPLLSLDEVLQYTGGRYYVLVACTDSQVFQESVLSYLYELCTPTEVQKAATAHVSFVKGIASFLVSTSDMDIKGISLTTQKRDIAESKRQLQTSGTVKVPKCLANNNNMKLAKFPFNLSQTEAQQECDPYILLVVKAVCVYSSIQDQRLLPGRVRPP